MQVIDALDRYYETTNANVHRGAYTLSEEATAQYEGARARVASFINACCPKEVIWTRNATEAINLVAYSWGRANLHRGDHILLTPMEHHSNIVPWQILAGQRGWSWISCRWRRTAPCMLDNLDRVLTSRTKLFAFTAMSNVLGTINPVKELVAAAHRVGALALVDGAQSVPHARSTCRRWTSTSWLSAATRCWGRRASACCGAGARSSTRCRLSWAAAT